MRTILFAAGLFFSTMAFAKQVQCVDEVLKTLVIHFKFDSSKPEFSYHKKMLNPDGSLKSETEEILLSPNSVCGRAVDFAKDCAMRERESSLGYDFDFRCPTQKIKGEFYLDEGNSAQFSCEAQDDSYHIPQMGDCTQK